METQSDQSAFESLIQIRLWLSSTIVSNFIKQDATWTFSSLQQPFTPDRAFFLKRLGTVLTMNMLSVSVSPVGEPM